jgi:hypothetical protein
MTPQRQVIIDAIKAYPNTPSMTLAKTIVEANPGLFEGVEHARSFIRYYRGTNGKKNRLNMPNTYENKYNLPESDEDEYFPYALPNYRNAVLLYDIHFPFHSISALNCALDEIKDTQPDCVYIGGDMLDFYQLSRFQKDPRRRSFNDELEMAKQFFQILRNLVPHADIIYQLGNHEERFENYMYSRAPELLGVSEFKLEALLQCATYGVKIIDKKRYAHKDGLNIIHGHEFGQQIFSPVNPARGLYLKAKRNAICGHHHQTSEHSEADIEGSVVTCWSVGCLSGLNPEYRPLNKYNHGYATVEFADGQFAITNRRIIHGRVV